MSVMVAELLLLESGEMMAPRIEDMTAIHALFGGCDDLAHEVEAEKLRTDYNRYYAMAGAPVPYLGSHATAMVVLGLNIVKLVRKYNDQTNGPKFLVRIGVGSGSAVGCVMGGITQLRYDVFGDAVDCALSMVKSSQLDGVRVDESTYTILNMAHLRDNYKFTERAPPSTIPGGAEGGRILLAHQRKKPEKPRVPTELQSQVLPDTSTIIRTHLQSELMGGDDDEEFAVPGFKTLLNANNENTYIDQRESSMDSTMLDESKDVEEVPEESETSLSKATTESPTNTAKPVLNPSTQANVMSPLDEQPDEPTDGPDEVRPAESAAHGDIEEARPPEPASPSVVL